MLRFAFLALFTLLTGCAAQAPVERPGDGFFERLRQLCGTQFVGYSTFPDEGTFAGERLVASVEGCGTDDELMIPFAVGDDASRTWWLRQTEQGLQLKHEHRLKDGSLDPITNYGGIADSNLGSSSRTFPADAETTALIPEASTNRWTLSLTPDGSELVYYLERHSQPRFRAVLKRQP